jgi:hypothetical protein
MAGRGLHTPASWTRSRPQAASRRPHRRENICAPVFSSVPDPRRELLSTPANRVHNVQGRGWSASEHVGHTPVRTSRRVARNPWLIRRIRDPPTWRSPIGRPPSGRHLLGLNRTRGPDRSGAPPPRVLVQPLSNRHVCSRPPVLKRHDICSGRYI